MIELRVNNVLIPLPPGTNIVQEKESFILNREKSAYDLTYPIDVPLTDEVIIALNFPRILANPNLKMEWPAEYLEDGQVIDVVTVKVLKISLKNKVANISIIGSYGSFARMVGENKLDTLTLGGARTIGAPNISSTYVNTYWTYYGNTTGQQHITDVMNGTVNTDYFFGQAVDYGTNIEQIHEDTTMAISGSTYQKYQIKEADGTNGIYKNIINAFNYNTNTALDPVFAFLNLTYRSTVPTPPDIISERFFTVPFFRLGYVLRKCFEEYGFTVTGNILANPAFNKVGLYNTYAINAVALAQRSSGGQNVYNITNKITPDNHMPDAKIIDFVIDTAKVFNLQYEINLLQKTVNIVDFKQGSVQMPIVDMSVAAVPDPDIVTEAQDFNKGFNFAFNWDTNDRRSGIGVKDDATWTNLVASVLGIAERDSYPATTGQKVFVLQDQTLYIKEDDGSWTLVTNVGAGYKTTTATDGQIELKASIVPMTNELLNVRHPVGGSSPTTIKAWPVVSEIGICGKHLLYTDLRTAIPVGGQLTLGTVDVGKLPIAPHMINWLGKRPMTVTSGTIFSDYAPTVTSMHYDACGEVQSDTSPLIWCLLNGNVGVYEDYWKALCTEISNGIQVEYEIQMDALSASLFDINKAKIAIDGLHYLCRRASIVKPYPAVSRFVLVRV